MGQKLDHVTHVACVCAHTQTHTHTILGIAVLRSKFLPEDSRKSFLGKKYLLKPERVGMSQRGIKRSPQQQQRQQHAWKPQPEEPGQQATVDGPICPSVFDNKVLLEHGLTHVLMYYLWLPSC